MNDRAGAALGSSSPRAALLVALGTAALSLALTLPSHVLRPGQNPPAPVDGRDYDNLALSLARGRGFVYCWSDPEWRAPYESARDGRDYSLQLSLGGPCIPTARRAPGYPLALAAVYRVWGRSFPAGRLLSAVALAMAGALGAFLAVRVGGVAASAVFALCFLIGGGELRFLVGAFMAEPLASLAVMAVLLAHVALLGNPKRQTGLLAGSLLGLLVLVRHHFSPLWGLGILGAAFGAIRSREQRPVWVAYGGAALLVFVPWALRNCLLLDAQMPFGTQGGHALAASYAEDEVKGSDGLWDPEPSARLWAKRQGKPSGYTFKNNLAREMRSSLAVERELAIAGQEAARAWLRRNWRRVPRVVFITMRAHARGYGILGLAAIVWGFAALAFPETRRVAALGLVILAMTALMVAVTYEEARGRYGAPVRPVAFLVGSLGLTASISRLMQARRRPAAS